MSAQPDSPRGEVKLSPQARRWLLMLANSSGKNRGYASEVPAALRTTEPMDRPKLEDLTLDLAKAAWVCGHESDEMPCAEAIRAMTPVWEARVVIHRFVDALQATDRSDG